MKELKPYVSYLITRVEHESPFSIKSSSSFEKLSELIEQRTKETISAPTLKRMWGYVNDRHTPYNTTLDILSKFVGHKGFSDFCKEAAKSDLFNSSFFNTKSIVSSELNGGETVEIGWSPNRYIKLLYKGESIYSVVEALNSKLEVGDLLTISSFMLNLPLYIPTVERTGMQSASFVAGESDGLTLLNLL
ncbi:MAG: hypothetical protein SNH79_01050 [Rikenellaceae bacterium]